MMKETYLEGWDFRSSVCSNQDVDKQLREPEISWDLFQTYFCNTELKELMLWLQLEKKNTEQTRDFSESDRCYPLGQITKDVVWKC